jgi:hypothetical protein
MAKELMRKERNAISAKKPRATASDRLVLQTRTPAMTAQPHLGNRALQRLLAQRSGDSAFALDDATASRINGARGGGQPLDGAVQKQMGESLGHDFSGVRVHTSGESHALNEQLNAKAFTTGSDIFFREGAYSPQSSSGQELIAHELTHVVQQGSGVVGGGGNTMKVNAPGDRFEQEADAVAKTVGNPAAATPSVQRATQDEDKLNRKSLQRQGMEEEPMPGAESDTQPKEDELAKAPAETMPMPEEEKTE